MKMFLYIVVGLITALGLMGWNMYKGASSYSSTTAPADFYSLSCTTLDGDAFDFATLKGSRVVIVNTASECGFTPQYKELQQLHEEYSEKGLIILGFPCNDFGTQESGSHEEIGAFCSKNFGVTFTMMEKVSVKGEETHPVYNWLLNKSENGVSDHNVRWNFHKFLVDENGSLVGSLRSGVSPMDKRIIEFAESEK
jgi:glutathione peroxidase